MPKPVRLVTTQRKCRAIGFDQVCSYALSRIDLSAAALTASRCHLCTQPGLKSTIEAVRIPKSLFSEICRSTLAGYAVVAHHEQGCLRISSGHVFVNI